MPKSGENEACWVGLCHNCGNIDKAAWDGHLRLTCSACRERLEWHTWRRDRRKVAIGGDDAATS
jgi:hypothetical protein